MSVKTAYSGMVWAMERHLRKNNEKVSQQIRDLLDEIGREFGILSRASAAILGPFPCWTALREQKRLAHGWTTYEPPSITERRNCASAG